jgi:hypothetical protein
MRRLLVLAAAVLTIGGLASVARAEASPQISGPTCAGNFTNATFNQLQVPSNAICRIINTTVNGGVSVSPGGAFETCNSTIKGWLIVDQGYVKIDNATQLLGGARITPPPTSMLSQAGTVACGQGESSLYSGIFCPRTLGGPLTVVNGGPTNLEFEIGGCGTINASNSITVTNNNVPIEIHNVNGPSTQIYCQGNTPPAVAINNNVMRVIGCQTQNPT